MERFYIAEAVLDYLLTRSRSAIGRSLPMSLKPTALNHRVTLVPQAALPSRSTTRQKPASPVQIHHVYRHLLQNSKASLAIWTETLPWNFRCYTLTM